jgi:RHS repeat-associated protein
MDTVASLLELSLQIAESTGTMYWTGPGGATLTETDLTGTINEEYIFFNGERLARVDRPSGTVHYYFSDHLGSASKIVGIVGSSAVLQEQYYYYPYGGTQSQIGSDPNHYKFTGKERDSESSLDNFGARYYGFTMGRFLTPDWAARPTSVPYAVFGDPQSLNLYGYVRNDPVSRADADGHCYYGNCDSGGYLMDALKSAVYSSSTGSGTIPSGWVSQEYLDLIAGSTPSAQNKPKHTPKHPKPKLFVKANASINNQSSKMVTTREVDYHSVTANGEYAKDHVLGLKEKCSGSCGGVSNAGSGNEQTNPYLIHEGEYEDQQTVYIDHPYTIEKRWSIDGQPAQVLDPSNKPFDYEILHNTNDSTPHFQTEYKNDSPN